MGWRGPSVGLWCREKKERKERKERGEGSPEGSGGDAEDDEDNNEDGTDDVVWTTDTSGGVPAQLVVLGAMSLIQIEL